MKRTYILTAFPLIILALTALYPKTAKSETVTEWKHTVDTVAPLPPDKYMSFHFPSGAAIYEEWEMTCYDCNCYGNPGTPNNREKYTKSVLGASDESAFYFQGVFTQFPEIWLKIPKNPNDVSTYSIDNHSILGMTEWSDRTQSWNDTIKFNPIRASSYSGGGNRYFSDYYYSKNTGNPLSFIWDEDHAILCQSDTVIGFDYGLNKVMSTLCYWDYWIDPDSEDRTIGIPGNVLKLYPPFKIDKFMNVSFRKITTGVDAPASEEVSDDRMTYDLTGRRVNPERLSPGIYIRNGRKFVVR